MNPSTSSMDMYKVSEDGGSFRLLGLDELPGKWMLEMKTFSTMYPEGDYGNMRCKYGNQVLLVQHIRPHGLYLQIVSLVILQCIYFSMVVTASSARSRRRGTYCGRQLVRTGPVKSLSTGI